MISTVLNNAGVAVLVVIGVLGCLVGLIGFIRTEHGLGNSANFMLYTLVPVFVALILISFAYEKMTSERNLIAQYKESYSHSNSIAKVLYKGDGTLFDAQQYLGLPNVTPVVVYDVDNNDKEYFEVAEAKLRFADTKVLMLHKYINTEVK